MNLSIVGTIPNLVIESDVNNIQFSALNIEKAGSNISLLHDIRIAQELGIAEHKGAFFAPCFYSYTNEFPDTEEVADVLASMRGIFERVLFSFWLVKDNSLHSNLIFGVTESDIIISRSPRTFTNSEGLYNENFFTCEEIKEAESWFEKMRDTNNNKKPLEFEKPNSKIGNFITYTEKSLILNTRLDRALRFILEARGQSFLPAKITFYISALESFLSNSNTKLRKQVADRGSEILGQTIEERVRINEVISKAYSLRSTYIHGAARTEKSIRQVIKPHSNVEELLIELDDILRRISKRFLTDLNYVVKMDNKEFSSWIKELLNN